MYKAVDELNKTASKYTYAVIKHIEHSGKRFVQDVIHFKCRSLKNFKLYLYIKLFSMQPENWKELFHISNWLLTGN